MNVGPTATSAFDLGQAPTLQAVVCSSLESAMVGKCWEPPSACDLFPLKREM